MSKKFGNKKRVKINNSNDEQIDENKNPVDQEKIDLLEAEKVRLEEQQKAALAEKERLEQEQKASKAENERLELAQKAALAEKERLEQAQEAARAEQERLSKEIEQLKNAQSKSTLVSFIDQSEEKKEYIPEKQVNFRMPLDLYKEIDEAKPRKMSITKFYQKLTTYYLEQKKQGSISF